MSIKFLREKENITQKELAHKLGITQSAISQWENGEILPRAELLPKLAKILECTVDELLQSVQN